MNTFKISELAKEFDITTRSIRFYEDLGLLTLRNVKATHESTMVAIEFD